MGRRVVRITRVKGPRTGNFVVYVTNKYSSLNATVKLFKAEILYLTVYNDNYNKKMMVMMMMIMIIIIIIIIIKEIGVKLDKEYL